MTDSAWIDRIVQGNDGNWYDPNTGLRRGSPDEERRVQELIEESDRAWETARAAERAAHATSDAAYRERRRIRGIS